MQDPPFELETGGQTTCSASYHSDRRLKCSTYETQHLLHLSLADACDEARPNDFKIRLTKNRYVDCQALPKKWHDSDTAHLSKIQV